MSTPQILLMTSLQTRFNRGIFHGIVTYKQQHTNWKLTHWAQESARNQVRFPFAGALAISMDPAIRRMAHQAHVPLVLMSNALNDPLASHVSVNEEVVGKMAADYLAELGLKHFAYVGHGDWPFVHERGAAFGRAVDAMGMGPATSLIGALFDRRRSARFHRDLDAMLTKLPRPCGLLTADDTLGVVVVEHCRALGLRVPEDIAILGVDDDEMACELSEVPLSSVSLPLFTIGFEAARLLHQQILRPGTPPSRLLFPPLRVVPRASSDLIALEDADVAMTVRLIRDHYAEPINVNWLVQRVPVARRSLERRFKKLVGRTMLQQLHHHRMRRARELLGDSVLPMKTIAQRSGFTNARWMADSFQREIQMTPQEYRRQFHAGG